MICRRTAFFAIVVAFCSRATAADPPVVSFVSLLDEMVDREAMARWPDPPFTLKQASSYDRRSTTPGNPDWFANVDWSNFIRTEKVKTASGERTEHVMLDEQGPGAIVRIWVGGYTDRGIIRFYIDGAAEPVLSGTADELIGGNKVFPKPFAETRARGRNLYAPIPYAKQIKVTYDGPLPAKHGNPGQEGFWYNINYRTYPAGTKAESFSLRALGVAKNELLAVGNFLEAEPAVVPTDFKRDEGIDEKPIVGGMTWKPEYAPGKERTFDIIPEGTAATVCKLSIQLNATNREAALQEMILIMGFDGTRTIYCPLSEFFGIGRTGGNQARDWWRRETKGNELLCHWKMPFRKKCTFGFKNTGKQRVSVESVIFVSDSSWDARSLYFHAGFRRDPAIDTSKKSDFNYITIKGRGVYMGDTLSLHNPVPNWWGEGDEKIFVDGERFPSHFGTGSEDYYGYAWGNTDVFNSPFHSQPRAGAKNQGHTTNSRVRMLDRIPFTKSLQTDMEVWHSRPTKVDYNVATFWYADADSTSNAQTDEKLLTAPPNPSPPTPHP